MTATIRPDAAVATNCPDCGAPLDTEWISFAGDPTPKPMTFCAAPSCVEARIETAITELIARGAISP